MPRDLCNPRTRVARALIILPPLAPYYNQNNTDPLITTATTFNTRAIGQPSPIMYSKLAFSNKNRKDAVLRAQVLTKWRH
jgi:hypothetical protein